MESLTCATILACAVHTKASRALTSLHKCWLRGTEKRSFILSRPGGEPTEAAFPGSSVQRAKPLSWRLSRPGLSHKPEDEVLAYDCDTDIGESTSSYNFFFSTGATDTYFFISATVVNGHGEGSRSKHRWHPEIFNLVQPRTKFGTNWLSVQGKCPGERKVIVWFRGKSARRSFTKNSRLWRKGFLPWRKQTGLIRSADATDFNSEDRSIKWKGTIDSLEIRKKSQAACPWGRPRSADVYVSRKGSWSQRFVILRLLCGCDVKGLYDRPGVCHIQEGSGEQGKMEETGCEIISGAPTTLAIKG